MKYLVDKYNNVITTADDEYAFMLENAVASYPDSKVVDSIPRKIVSAGPVQPVVDGMQTI